MLLNIELPRGLSREILEKVVTQRLEDKYGIGTATRMVTEQQDPFLAKIEVINPNGIWIHVYIIYQEGVRFFLEFKKTREEAKKFPEKIGTNLGELLQKAKVQITKP